MTVSGTISFSARVEIFLSTQTPKVTAGAVYATLRWRLKEKNKVSKL